MPKSPAKITEPRSEGRGKIYSPTDRRPSATGVKIPDPILAQPVRKKMTFRQEAVIIFVVGFLAGWFWMTWAMRLEPPIGLADYSFWRLLLPW